MFEIEDLFELSLDGAFASLEEFKDFANGVDDETLFSVITPGAFKDLEEFKSFLRWGRGSYGIYYRHGNSSWIFGFFRSKKVL